MPESQYQKWWISPVDGLLVCGDPELEQAVVGFCFGYGVRMGGGLVASSDSQYLEDLGLPMLANRLEAEKANVQACDAAIIHGPPSEFYFKCGKPYLSFTVRGPDLEKGIQDFILEVRPSRLLIARFSDQLSDGDEDESLAATILPAVFAAGDDRDLWAGVMSSQEFRERTANLLEHVPHGWPEPDINRGWLPAIEDMYSAVNRALVDPVLRAAFRWDQIKEKFGGLRCYYDGGPLHIDFVSGEDAAAVDQFVEANDSAGSDISERLRKIVDPIVATAVERCSRTCEMCGQPGVLRRRLYLSTLCDLHARPGLRLQESSQ